jgi:hypothetical protein
MGVLDRERDGRRYNAAETMPATKRANPNNSTVGATAARAIAVENHAMHPSITRLRPTRSVIVPITIAPISIPTSAYAPMRPASAGPRTHSADPPTRVGTTVP